MKYLLDTNVISELARRRVRGSLDQRLEEHGHEVCISSLTLHELRYGIARLLDSKRKKALKAFLEDVVMSLPILNYDARAAGVACLRAGEIGSERADTSLHRWSNRSDCPSERSHTNYDQQTRLQFVCGA